MSADTIAPAAGFDYATTQQVLNALFIKGYFTDALRTAEQADGAAYIEAITDPYETPPMYKKLRENVKSF